MAKHDLFKRIDGSPIDFYVALGKGREEIATLIKVRYFILFVR